MMNIKENFNSKIFTFTLLTFNYILFHLIVARDMDLNV